MYFDTDALTALISDNALALKLAPRIREDWKRVTSPVAVVDTARRLAAATRPSGAGKGAGKGTEKGAEKSADKSAGKTASFAEHLKVVEEFLDLYDIELRDMPPATKLLECVAAGSATGDLAASLNAACVAYYEAPVFDVDSAASAGSEPASAED